MNADCSHADCIDENSELVHSNINMSRPLVYSGRCFYKTVEEYSVGQASWLQVPAAFGHSYLQHGVDNKTSCFLENMSGNLWPVIFSADGFYYGWASFAADNGLVVGDMLVFTLMEEHRFVVWVFSHESGMDKSMVSKGEPSRSTKIPKKGALDICPKPAFQGFKGCRTQHGSESGNKIKTHDDELKLFDSDNDVLLLESVPEDWRSTSKGKIIEIIDVKGEDVETVDHYVKGKGLETIETIDVKGKGIETVNVKNKGPETVDVKGKGLETIKTIDVKSKDLKTVDVNGQGIENLDHVQHDYLKHETADAINLLARIGEDYLQTFGSQESNALQISDNVWECRKRNQLDKINPFDMAQPSMVSLLVTPQTEFTPNKDEAQPPAKRKCDYPLKNVGSTSLNDGILGPQSFIFESRRRPVTQMEQEAAFASAHGFASKMQKMASLVVVMRQTSVYRNFMMHIKKSFAKMYMPKEKKAVHLCNSEERMWICTWNPLYSSLSGVGWRNFALDHCLEEDDVLVLEIVSESITVLHIVVHIFRVVPIRDGLTGWQSHNCL